jgi:hypothetical protein
MEALADEFEGPGPGYDGRKPAGALPRCAAHVDFEQEGLPGTHHGQQERARRRLLHAVRRHGRWLRCAQGRAEDAGLRAVPLPQFTRALYPRAGDRAPAVGGAAPDQKDEDSLPPYDVLDRILELYVEQDYSAEAIIAEGIAREHVERAVRLVDLNEYKRRQAPVGVRITPARLRPRSALSDHLGLAHGRLRSGQPGLVLRLSNCGGFGGSKRPKVARLIRSAAARPACRPCRIRRSCPGPGGRDN